MSPRWLSNMCRSRMYAAKGNSNSCPLGLTSLIDLHLESIAASGASIISMHLTRGRRRTISSLTGKYSPHRTGLPRSFFFSKTLTFKPFCDRWTAADRPPGPPPTMITSYFPAAKFDQQYLLGRLLVPSNLWVWQRSRATVIDEEFVNSTDL